MINEIDGVPRAYMDLTDGAGNTVRFVYRTIYYRASESEIQGIWDALKAEMETYQEDDLIIIFRKRPEIIRNLTREKPLLYVRFATSPPLPEEFWKKHEREEADVAKDWKP